MKNKILLLTTYLLLSNSILTDQAFCATSEVKENTVVNEKKSNPDLIDEVLAFIDENFSGSEVKKEVKSSVKNKLGLDLLESIKNSETAKAKELITQGADINAKDKLGFTPAILAIIYNNKEIVKLLIDKGIDVNYKNEKGSSLLDFVGSYKQKDIAELLINNGAKYDLRVLLSVNDVAKAKLLIDQGADVNKKYEGGFTPLIIASQSKNNIEIINLLINKGADVNAKTNYGMTALMMSALFAEKPVSELLINKGADVNARDNEGNNALKEACTSGNKEEVELLISKGIDINNKDNDGATALMTAAGLKYKDIVDLLIKKGADVNIQDNKGYTALIQASLIKGNKEVVKILIDKGANVNVKAHKGESLLKFVTKYGKADPEILALLKKAGAK